MVFMLRRPFYDCASALYDAESEKQQEVDQSSGIVDCEYGGSPGEVVLSILRSFVC
jgi:hypothetical protein